MKKLVSVLSALSLVALLSLTSCEKTVDTALVKGWWKISRFDTTKDGSKTTMTLADYEQWEPKTEEERQQKEAMLPITNMNFTLTEAGSEKTFMGYMPIYGGGFTQVDGTWSISGTKVTMIDEWNSTKWTINYNQSENTMVMSGTQGSTTVDYVFAKQQE